MVNIFFSITDFVGVNNFTGHLDFVELSEIVGPGVSGSVISFNGPVKAHPDSTGTVTFTNVFPNYYHVAIHHVTHLGRILNREFDILVPSFGGTYNGKDLQVNIDPPPALDSRYVLKNAIDPYFVAGTGVTLSSSFTGSIERITINSSGGGGGGSSLGTGSTYPFTSSWSNTSRTSSFLTGSHELSGNGKTMRVYWNNSGTTIGAPSTTGNDAAIFQDDGTTILVGTVNLGVQDPNCVLATNGASNITATTLTIDGSGNVHGTLFGIASLSTSSSYAKTSSFLDNGMASINGTGDARFKTLDVSSHFTVDGTGQLSTDAGAFFSTLVTANNGITASNGGAIGVSVYGTASFATSASWAPSTGGTTLNTGSTYPITASWAQSSSVSISSSYALSASYAVTSSRAISTVSSSYALSASYAPSTPGTLGTGSSYPFTSSWANSSSVAISSSYALSASYAPSSGGGLATGSTYPITASWSNNSVSSSYVLGPVTGSVNAPNVTATTLQGSNLQTTAGVTIIGIGSRVALDSGANTVIDWQNKILSGAWSLTGSLIGTSSFAVSSSYAITASFTNSSSVAVSASWAPAGPTSLTTGSSYPITSSWSLNSLTASFVASSSYALSSSYSLSGSYSLSSSYALSSSIAQTSSYLTNYQGYITDTTASNNSITLSFASPNHQLNLTTAHVYSFTSSNTPTVAGQCADIVCYISHSSATTSSLTIPAAWKNVGGTWPTAITASTVATLWLRAIDTNQMIGTWNSSQ